MSFTMSVPRLETERLILRELRDSDWDAYAKLMANPNVVRFIGGETKQRPEVWWQVATLAGHWAIKGYGPFAVERKEDGVFLGRVGFLHGPEWPGPEIAWTLDEPYWGKGYAKEAALAAMRWGFDTIGFEKLCSMILPDNTPSIKLAEAVGESYERDYPFRQFTVRLYSIARADFYRLHGPSE